MTKGEHTYVRDRPYILSTTLLCEGIMRYFSLSKFWARIIPAWVMWPNPFTLPNELEALAGSLDKTCLRYTMEISAEQTSANGIQREIKVKRQKLETVTSYGLDKLNLWPFYHLIIKCDLDLQPTWTNISNGTATQGEQLKCHLKHFLGRWKSRAHLKVT